MICQSTNQPANQPSTQQGERNMTTNPTPTLEPTSLNAVVVGKLGSGKTAVAVQADDDDTPWALVIEGRCEWHSWTSLRRELTDIRVVPMAELARPTKVAGCARCDRIGAHALGIEGLLGRRRDQLANAREEIERIWYEEIDPILDRFIDAEERVWSEVNAVVAKHGGGSDE